MDLLQKYTKDETFYELDEAVLLTLDHMSPLQSSRVIMQIQRAVDKIQRKNHITSRTFVDDPLRFGPQWCWHWLSFCFLS